MEEGEVQTLVNNKLAKSPIYSGVYISIDEASKIL